jgi:hypothetical protein
MGEALDSLDSVERTAAGEAALAKGVRSDDERVVRRWLVMIAWEARLAARTIANVPRP